MSLAERAASARELVVDRPRIGSSRAESWGRPGQRVCPAKRARRSRSRPASGLSPPARRYPEIPPARASRWRALTRVRDAPPGHPPRVWPDRPARDGLAVPLREGRHVSHNPSGVAYDQRARWDLAADDRERADDRVVADPRAREDHRSGAHEDTFADRRTGDPRASCVESGASVVGENDRPSGDHAVIADLDQPGVAGVDIYPAPDVDVPTELEALRDQAIDVLLAAQPLPRPALYGLECPLHRSQD